MFVSSSEQVMTCYISIKILCQWGLKIKFIYFVGVNFRSYFNGVDKKRRVDSYANHWRQIIDWKVW